MGGVNDDTPIVRVRAKMLPIWDRMQRASVRLENKLFTISSLAGGEELNHWLAFQVGNGIKRRSTHLSRLIADHRQLIRNITELVNCMKDMGKIVSDSDRAADERVADQMNELTVRVLTMRTGIVAGVSHPCG